MNYCSIEEAWGENLNKEKRKKKKRKKEFITQIYLNIHMIQVMSMEFMMKIVL